MRILITGSRHWLDYRAVRAIFESELASLPTGDTLYVRHGANPRGADNFAHHLCDVYAKYGVVEESYPADWDRFGNPAGSIRNGEMIASDDVDRVHAFPLQDSTGTIDMMKKAVAKHIPVFNHGWAGAQKLVPEAVDVKRQLGQ